MFDLSKVPAIASQEGAIGRTLKRLSQALRGNQVPAERREHRRLPAHGVISALWLDYDDNEQQAVVNIVDISPRGLAFRSPSAVPVGNTVLLGDGRMTLSAYVHRCTQEGREFTIGAEIRGGQSASLETRVKLLGSAKQT